MEFPAWLAEILKQFPVVVLCGVVLWRAAKYLDSKHTHELQTVLAQQGAHEQTVLALTARHLEDLKAQHAGQVESMQREIDRLVNNLTDVTKDRDRLLRKLIQDDKKE
jgi:hypothetical protein